LAVVAVMAMCRARPLFLLVVVAVVAAKLEKLLA
jgi:hypothetical protein